MIFTSDKIGPSACFCVGAQNGEKDCPCVLRAKKALTPAKGEPMPRTVEHYQANAERDQELILEQRDEIGTLQQKVGQLEKTQLKLLLRLERKDNEHSN